MGGITSKSGFSRRNSVERRSQRRTLSSTNAELQKIEKQVEKFKGKKDDDEYNQIKSKIVNVRKRLQKLTPLPNNKEKHAEQFKLLKDLAVLLEERATTNEHSAKTSEEQTSRSSAQSPIQRRDSDATDISRASSNIRKTVEIKMVQVTPPERPNSEASVRSPEDKRKSILKMGVPVMPLAVMENQRRISYAASSNNVTPTKSVQLQSKETDLSFIEQVKKDVGDIELEISEFKGTKMDENYVRLRDQLFKNLEKLSTISVKDDLLVQEKEQCVQFVRSCLNFLEEKSAQGSNGEDDVFLPSPEKNNNNDVNNLTKKLTATSV